MKMILKEDIFDRFITLILKKYQKDPKQFIFIMGNRLIIPSFDDFLKESKIPFRKAGVSVTQGRESLTCASLDYDSGFFPFGLYFIYPESTREIVLYFYKNIDDDRFDDSPPRYIAGYRNRKDYEELISFYNRYYASRKREERKIIVYGGNVRGGRS